MSGEWQMLSGGTAFLSRHLGAAGAALLSALLWVYWNWDKLAAKPGIGWLDGKIRRLSRLPTAVPGKFNVMLAVFENDPGGRNRENIFSWLQKIDGVAVTRTQRKIATGDAAAGHRQARRWLRRCGADALIWGRILQGGGSAREPDLFWTAASGDPYKRGGERYAAPLDDLRLPQLFWDDFLEVLRLHIATQAAEVAARGALRGGDAGAAHRANAPSAGRARVPRPLDAGRPGASALDFRQRLAGLRRTKRR